MSRSDRLGAWRELKSWDDVSIGMVVYLKYYNLWHAVLVTGKDTPENCVRGIHYALPGFWGTHVVSEDNFFLNIENGELWEYCVPEDMRRSPEEAIEIARKLIGEKKFNMFFRRSEHMILECVLKNK